MITANILRNYLNTFLKNRHRYTCIPSHTTPPDIFVFTNAVLNIVLILYHCHKLISIYLMPQSFVYTFFPAFHLLNLFIYQGILPLPPKIRANKKQIPKNLPSII